MDPIYMMVYALVFYIVILLGREMGCLRENIKKL
jgi:hypothetical protein